MSDKYIKLYQMSEQEQPAESGIPVKIMAGALLLDQQQQRVIAQVKYKNTSQKSIRSMTVNVNAYDKNGTVLEGVKHFEYENLIAGSMDLFGDRIPIIMEDNNTASFSVDITTVVYSDGSVWRKAVEDAIKGAEDAIKGAAVIGSYTAEVATEAAGAVTKAAKLTFPFIINTIVFIILLLGCIGVLTGDMTSTSDYIEGAGIIAMTIIAFPSIGAMLRKKPNGKKLCIIRWLIVIAIEAVVYFV